MGFGTFSKVVIFLALLTGCDTLLNTDDFETDGVIYRKTIVSAVAARDRGPFCGQTVLESGIKGLQPLHNAPVPPPDYLVGPGDELLFNIFGEAGLNSVKARVDNAGFVQLPIIELVYVAGLHTRQIHRQLKVLFSQVFNDPWLTVELDVAESQPIYFLGEFRSAGVAYLERPTNVIEAIAMGGGLEEDAYLAGARLLRNNQICTVDLHALLREGDFSQNVTVQARDAIFAPRKEDMSVYVLGAVGSPGSVAYGADGRSLLQAVSMSGGLVDKAALPEQVRILRPLSPTSAEFILVNMKTMLTGAALDYQLEPGDVVYVPNSPVSTWNAALDEMLASLEFIGGVVTPISLIRALQDS
jgi:polysaccharide export outer membrane protein